MERYIALQFCFQPFARSEAVASPHFLDATVEPLDHAVSLGRLS